VVARAAVGDLIAPYAAGADVADGFRVVSADDEGRVLLEHPDGRRLEVVVSPLETTEHYMTATRSYAIGVRTGAPRQFAAGEIRAVEAIAAAIAKNDRGLPVLAPAPMPSYPAVRASAREVWVVLRSPCEMHCLFCTRGVGGSQPKDDVIEAVDYLGELRAVPFVPGRRLCIGGDEPLTHPALGEIVGAARELGYGEIEVRTSGQRLGEPGVAAALVERGVTHVELPVYGSSPEVHDRVTMLAGSHTGLWHTIGVLRALPVAFGLHSVLVRQNLSDAPRLCAEILQRLGLRLSFTVPAPRADAADYRQVAPSFSEVVRALAGTGVGLWGYPSCVARAVEPNRAPGERQVDPSERTLREYPEICNACRLKPSCPGVQPVHREAFGDEGLVPVR
jgi:MoaA/NifB/PqqE/SkfB family radical SAM enzyme